MNCPVCGTVCADNAQNCPTCGQALAPQPQQPAYQQPVYQQPVYQQPVYQQPMYQQPMAPALGMKWYKFMIYFGLWAGAVVNAVYNGFNLLTGSHYGDYASMVYAYYDGLEASDKLFGVLFIALAAMQIYTRFRLAGYKKNGPSMVTLVYGGAIALSVVYAVVTMGITGEELEMSTLVTNVAVNIAMLFANMTYFKKRQHLFVNN